MRRRSGIPLLTVGVLTLAGCADRTPVPTAPHTRVPDAQADVAEPNPPVIYLHYDYMVSTDPAQPHSHAPDPEAIAMVVDAFRRQGITLHIDPVHTAIPEVAIVKLADGEDSPGCVTLSELRQTYFHPQGTQPWHYAVFAHYASAGACDTSYPTGVAELPGYDFVVALAHLFIDEKACPGAFSVEACRLAEGGTFMHELGHNLDLHHGGGDDTNFKPNYLSVMNYAWQIAGILSGTTPGDTVFATATRRLDYSALALPSLDESHLDERVGLGGPADDRMISGEDAWVPATNIGFFRLVPTTGPIDWNGNGVIEPDVRVNLNDSWDELSVGPGTHIYEVLRGFDDWAHVQQFLQTPAYLTGTLRSSVITP